MKQRKTVFFFILFIQLIICSITYASDDIDLNISSDSAILIDLDSGLTLYEKNSTQKMYPASTTKIMTAILTIENCDLSEKVTAHNSVLSLIPEGYSSAYLVDGEELTVEELLSVLLVHSANDAANVLAEYISGSIESFSDLMNEKASALGCENTHFCNPSGMHNENHYTTAKDLSIIAKYCMSNSTFRKLISQKSCTIPQTNKSDVRQYTNTNSLLNPSSRFYIENCIGGKTGFTSQAKNCLISFFKQDDLELISVILGAQTTDTGDSARYADTTSIYNYGYSNYKIQTIAQKNDIVENIEIKNGTKDTKFLDLVLENDIKALVKNDDNNLDYNITLNDNISAPISQNAQIGTITYSINGYEYQSNLLASHDVYKNDYTLFILISILVCIVIIIILILLLFIRIKKKREKFIKYNQEY